MKKKILFIFSFVLVLAILVAPAIMGEVGAAIDASDSSAVYTRGAITAVDESGEAAEEYNEMVADVLKIINTYVIRSLLIVAVIIFTIFGIINFIKFSKATEEEARQKAKKNLIGWGLGAIGTFACVWLLPMLFDFLISLMPRGTIGSVK